MEASEASHNENRNATAGAGSKPCPKRSLQADSIIPAAAELTKFLLGRRHLWPDLHLPTSQIAADQMPRIEGDDGLAVISLDLQWGEGEEAAG